MRWFPGWLLLAAGGCTWDTPVLDSPFGPPPLLNSVAGEMVFAGEGELAPTFISVFDARNPGPPAGTGSPITFSVVGVDEWSGTELPAAPWNVTQLPDGEFFVSALMDVDEDFNPLEDTLAGATCGDWVGTSISDLVTLTPVSITFPTRNPDDVARGVLLDNVPLLIGQQITTERPVFTFVGQPTISLNTLATSEIPPTFAITVEQVDAEYGNIDPNSLDVTVPVQLGASCAPDPALDGAPIDLLGWRSCDLATFAPCSTALLTELRDADGDGALDPSVDPALAAQGIPELWPRVFLEYVPGPEDEPLDVYFVEGALLTERWLTQAFPLLLQIQGAALQGYPPDVVAPVGQSLLANELSVTLTPVFIHFWEGGQIDNNDGRGPYDIIDARVAAAGTVPTGQYGATVITRTGQTWTVPNSLGGGLRPVTSEFDLSAQGASLRLDP